MPFAASVIPDFSLYNGEDTFRRGDQIYKKVKMLGKGAAGAVDLFRSDAGHPVAVKSEVAYENTYGDGRRFLAEARRWQEIYGDSAAQFSGDPEDATKPHYILMDFFEGQTLYAIHYLSSDRFALHMIKLASAIQSLHDKNLVHGDLSPLNAIVTPRPSGGADIKLIDFGFTRKIDQRASCLLPASENNRYAPERIVQAGRTTYGVKKEQDFYGFGYVLNYLSKKKVVEQERSSQIKIDTIAASLQKTNPEERWDLKKSIFYLYVLFISTPSRPLHETDPSVMPLVKLYEDLESEIEEKNDAAKRKKLTGLVVIYSAWIARVSDLPTATREAKAFFPELTAGFFSRSAEVLKKLEAGVPQPVTVALGMMNGG